VLTVFYWLLSRLLEVFAVEMLRTFGVQWRLPLASMTYFPAPCRPRPTAASVVDRVVYTRRQLIALRHATGTKMSNVDNRRRLSAAGLLRCRGNRAGVRTRDRLTRASVYQHDSAVHSGSNNCISIVSSYRSPRIRKSTPRPRVLIDVDCSKTIYSVNMLSDHERPHHFQPPTLYVFNAASLVKPHAIEQLSAELDGYHIDIAVISETHLKTKHADNLVSIEGFQLFRRDRAGRRGGGVAVYARASLNSSLEQPDGDNKSFELLWVRVRSGDRDVIIGALYHPPSPIYQTDALLNYIDASLDDISRKHPNALIVLAGDLNTLPEQDIVARSTLIPIVDQPTRGLSKLDRIYTSEPSYDEIKVVASAVKSDHKAIVAYTGVKRTALRKTREVRTFRKRSPTQHAMFLSHVAGLNIELEDSPDAQRNFDQLYSTLLNLLEHFYPERSVTLTSSDPAYVTPDVKTMMRRKNRLMRAGRVDEAGALASRIGAAIIRRNTAQLRRVDAIRDTKEMWTKVRELTKPRSKGAMAPPGITAQVLNAHYASVSTDPSYEPPKPKLTCLGQLHSISEAHVFHILDHLHPTATGLDQIPAWFLRLGAPVFAAPIAQLFNQSMASATVPHQWKKAYITPIPKIPHPTAPTEYRPISITPVLSRVMERHVVRTYLYPAIQHPPQDLYFQDQFAFRPTGSTVAALIAMLHTINDMLSRFPFVRVFALDFSKAFDTVRHSTLLEKLAKLDLPDEVYNWIEAFFDEHSHCTKFAGFTSTFVTILASVIQGSAIGPGAYLVNASDLRPAHHGNALFKFADDTYLVVPSTNSHTCDDELVNVETWATANNLKLNQAKSKEIVFQARGIRGKRVQPPPPVSGVDRVSSLTVLGVVVNDRLTADDHVSATVAACSKSLYALRVLRTHGMPGDALHEVFRATVLAKLLYCSPAWSGLCRATERARLNAFLRRSKRSGYCSENTPNINELFDEADKTLFKRVLTDNRHVLHPLLPAQTQNRHGLRHRRHDRELPTKTAQLDESNFLIRMLYKDIY